MPRLENNVSKKPVAIRNKAKAVLKLHLKLQFIFSRDLSMPKTLNKNVNPIRLRPQCGFPTMSSAYLSEIESTQDFDQRFISQVL